MQIIIPSDISADNSGCVWTNVRDFQIATMGDSQGPELKSIMAKTELVVEVGLKLAVYEDFVYFPFHFFRMTVLLFTKNRKTKMFLRRSHLLLFMTQQF